MKKFLLFVILAFLGLELFSQSSIDLQATVIKKISAPYYGGSPVDILEGKTIMLKGFSLATTFQDPLVTAIYENKEVIIYLKDLNKLKLEEPKTMDQLWWITQLNSDLYPNLYSKGFQYDKRKDLEDETIESLSRYEKTFGFFQDDYLEDYLQSLLYKIHPITLNDSRPGNLNIKILHTNDLNAFCCPNGTLVITTGLLSTLRSEDELIAVLAHEVAHYVLDHHIVNINKAIDRKQRAEFWAGLATGLAAASEVYMASKYKVYTGGNLTMATAMLASNIANTISDRLGIKYSQEQEFEADLAATKVLKFLNKDPKVLSSALGRIQTYYTLTGDFVALSGSGSHPALQTRINIIGQTYPDQFINKSYDKLISFVNTSNAISEFGLKHFQTVLQLTSRNIDAGVGTEEDFLYKGMTIRALFDNPEKNQEVLDLIIKAKSLNVYPINYVNKQEGITLLRFGRKKEAITSFQDYLNNLEAEKDPSQFILDEIEWTKKMIYKTQAL